MLSNRDRSEVAFELEILHELSHARSNPGAVAEALRSRLQHFKSKEYFPPERGGKTAVVTKEGQAAVHDAISYLERSEKLPALADALVQGLSLAAGDHQHDLGETGAVRHQGADGSTSSDRMLRYGTWSGKCGECLWYGRMGASAKQIIEDLIVDDGVPSRGHRLGIYDPAFRVAGVCMGPHKTFGACCVIEFANRFEDDEARLVARVASGPPAVVAGKEAVKTQWKDLGTCPGCKETIRGGSVMEALGHKWHAECFACQAEGCNLKLRGVPYQEHGGKPFCKDCYCKHFGSTCAGCGEKIQGAVLMAAGKTWHKECFVCNSCKGPLEKGHATRDGKPICSGCSRSPCKAAALPLVAQRRAPALAKAGAAAIRSSSQVGGARRAVATPPPKTPPAKADSRMRTPPLAKGGMPPKIAAGRCAIPAPKIAIGSAKKSMDALTMSYADLA